MTTPAISVNSQVVPVARENAAPALRVRFSRTSPSTIGTGARALQAVDRDGLGQLVEPDHQDRGHREDTDQPAPGWRGRRCPARLRLIARRCHGLVHDGDQPAMAGRAGRSPPPRGGQRRSCCCLQVTHRVARGKACNRSLPIGLPHDSHAP